MPINYFNIENGVAGFSQKNYQTEAHAHFSIELVFALSGSIDISTYNRKYPNIQAAVIRSNVRHTLNCLEGECQIYFIDPAANIGERILKCYHAESKDLVVLDTIEAEEFKEKHTVIDFDFESRQLCLTPKKKRIEYKIVWI